MFLLNWMVGAFYLSSKVSVYVLYVAGWLAAVEQF